MEGGYNPDGWLGFIEGAKLYYDFGGEYPFEDTAAHLLRGVQHDVERKLVAVSDEPVVVREEVY